MARLIVILFTLILTIIKGVFSLLMGLVRLLGSRPRAMGVPYIVDGDTIGFNDGTRVRFFGIDAPEMSDPNGRLAKRHLSRLINGRPVFISVRDRDDYGRLVAVVRLEDGTDLCAKMVDDGYAVAMTGFSRAYVRHQRRAQKTRTGLWQFV